MDGGTLNGWWDTLPAAKRYQCAKKQSCYMWRSFPACRRKEHISAAAMTNLSNGMQWSKTFFPDGSDNLDSLQKRQLLNACSQNHHWQICLNFSSRCKGKWCIRFTGINNEPAFNGINDAVHEGQQFWDGGDFSSWYTKAQTERIMQLKHFVAGLVPTFTFPKTGLPGWMKYRIEPSHEGFNPLKHP